MCSLYDYIEFFISNLIDFSSDRNVKDIAATQFLVCDKIKKCTVKTQRRKLTRNQNNKHFLNLPF